MHSGGADKEKPSLRLVAGACKAFHQAHAFRWRLALTGAGLTTPVQRMHAKVKKRLWAATLAACLFDVARVLPATHV